MDIQEYSKLAIRTANDHDMLGNACFGIGGESGEILDLVKKYRYHGKDLDALKLKAEIGDLLWYVNALIHSMAFTWEDVLETNIRKLETRYPDLRFNQTHANNRDLEAERRAMEEVGR